MEECDAVNCNWERSIPFYKIDEKIADQLFKRFDSKLMVKRIYPLAEGCRNTNYMVHAANSSSIFLLRIFPLSDKSWEKEMRLLNLLKDKVQVQKLYFISQDESIELRNYAIYEFVEGISLQEAIQCGYTPEEKLICEIAGTAALIHNHSYKDIGFLDENLEVKNVLPPLVSWYKMFLGNHAKNRLGLDLVRKIENMVFSNKNKLQEIDSQIALVHGDFRPTNILINNGKLSCVLDWEFAMAGHPLADIAQFFRCRKPFNEHLIQVFENRYSEAAAAKLPDNWIELGKIRDLANLLQMINAEEDFPKKYRDVNDLIADIVEHY